MPKVTIAASIRRSSIGFRRHPDSDRIEPCRSVPSTKDGGVLALTAASLRVVPGENSERRGGTSSSITAANNPSIEITPSKRRVKLCRLMSRAAASLRRDVTSSRSMISIVAMGSGVSVWAGFFSRVGLRDRGAGPDFTPLGRVSEFRGCVRQGGPRPRNRGR